MDLFEIIIFGVIAASGLLSEVLKKRRQERIKRERRDSEASPTVSPSNPQTTETIDSELDLLLDEVEEEQDSVMKDFDSLLEEVIFGKPSSARRKKDTLASGHKNGPFDSQEKEQFERLTSLENRPSELLYKSSERKISREKNISLEQQPGFQVSSDRSSSLPITSKASRDSATTSERKKSVLSQFRSPNSVRDAIIATEVLSKPLSRRNDSSILSVRPHASRRSSIGRNDS